MGGKMNISNFIQIEIKKDTWFMKNSVYCGE